MYIFCTAHAQILCTSPLLLLRLFFFFFLSSLAHNYYPILDMFVNFVLSFSRLSIQVPSSPYYFSEFLCKPFLKYSRSSSSLYTRLALRSLASSARKFPLYTFIYTQCIHIRAIFVACHMINSNVLISLLSLSHLFNSQFRSQSQQHLHI